MNLKFDDILGHSQPVRVLRQAIQNDRMAHAYLFAGPDGIGKRTCAYAFGAAVNCELNSDHACGVCSSCRKIIDGNYPDFMLIEPEGNFIKIEQVREISRQLHFAPYEGRTRCVLFLDAEKLNPAAANALLKTLEEPRPNNLLILVSANPQQLLPTILSRCQRINFSPLSVADIEIFARERLEIEQGEARLLARLSGGSIGWILNADVDAIVQNRRDLLSELAGLDPADEVAIASFAEKIIETDTDLTTTFELLKTFLRDAAILAGRDNTDRLINIDIEDQIRNYASRFSASRIINIGRSVGYAQRLLSRNVNKNFVAMSLALELVHPTGAGFDSKRMPR